MNKDASTTGEVSEITFGYDAMQHRTTKLVEHLSSTDYEKSYYIYDAQGNVMAVYSENSVSSVATTRQDELPIYGSDRLGLVRRNLELGDQADCPYCPQDATILPGMLRIVEGTLRIPRFLYDSPLSNPTEDHEGEFVVLRNATGLRIPLASISVTYPGGVHAFGGSDYLGPYEFAIVANWTGSPGSFATQYGLAGYNTDPKVNWFWDNAMTLPDPASRGRSACGTVSLLDFTDGVPTLLDPASRGHGAVNFGGSGITASNAYCATACSTAQTVQLDNFLTSPPGAFDAGEWAAATITGKGTIGSGSFVLENSYARELGLCDYELKDHLGNVRVVVSDKKLSDIVSGLPEDFRAEVLTMRDYYAFGMEMPGAVYSAGTYRYGFNGMERDDEVKGSGMSYDFGARMYDPRVGRWWSCDPLMSQRLWLSPFNFVQNNPTYRIDPNGMLDDWYVNKKGILLGTDGDQNSNQLRLINKSRREFQMFLHYSKEGTKEERIANLRANSKVVKVLDAVEQTKVVNAVYDKTVETGFEAYSMIYLDLTKLELKFGPVVEGSDKHASFAKFDFPNDDPETQYISGSNGTKVIIGSIHGHPPVDNLIEGVSTVTNESGGNDLKMATKYATAVFAVDAKYIHYVGSFGWVMDKNPREMEVLMKSLEIKYGANVQGIQDKK